MRGLYGWIALALLVGISIYVRWPGFTQGGFASHDVAGILYSGMLLDAGLLPYVDSVEMKSPGTFYLAWAFAGPRADDIAKFQIAANSWAIASLCVVAAIGWRHFGPRAGLTAAALYGLHDAYLDTMDANYITWAQLPLLIAVGAALEALRSLDRRRSMAWFAVAGLFAGFATLAKLQAGVALMFAGAAAIWPRSLDDATGRDLRLRAIALAVVALAFLAAHAPIALHYAMHDQLSALWRGYVANDWGMQYVAFGTEELGTDAVREGTFATVYFLALPLALAAFTVFGSVAAPRPELDLSRLLWIATGCTVLAAWVGFRFYKDYFLIVAPPLCLLAAAPGGLLGAHGPLRGWKRGLALLPAVALLGRQLVLLEAERVNRSRAHDAGGRIIARHIDRNTPPDARIWVWGWHLWDVYALTGRLAGTRYYKVEGLVTTGNDVTWRRPTPPPRFVPGPHAERLVEELRASKPHYIVLGSTAPSGTFESLRTLLQTEYRRDSTVRLNRVQFWRRRDIE